MRYVPYCNEILPYCIEGGGGGGGGGNLKILTQNRSKYCVLKKMRPNS